jgi:hypothetical protein
LTGDRITLVTGLARELPTGLAAVAVNPGIIDADMLRTCWADDAELFLAADGWAVGAAPFLLALLPKDNGRSVTVA